jgi:hypothetical protein
LGFASFFGGSFVSWLRDTKRERAGRRRRTRLSLPGEGDAAPGKKVVVIGERSAPALSALGFVWPSLRGLGVGALPACACSGTGGAGRPGPSGMRCDGACLLLDSCSPSGLLGGLGLSGLA